MTISAMTHRDPAAAFYDAIVAGKLSDCEAAENFAGNFMYMGTQDGRDAFKNIDTRAYLYVLTVRVA